MKRDATPTPCWIVPIVLRAGIYGHASFRQQRWLLSGLDSQMSVHYDVSSPKLLSSNDSGSYFSSGCVRSPHAMMTDSRVCVWVALIDRCFLSWRLSVADTAVIFHCLTPPQDTHSTEHIDCIVLCSYKCSSHTMDYHTITALVGQFNSTLLQTIKLVIDKFDSNQTFQTTLIQRSLFTLLVDQHSCDLYILRSIRHQFTVTLSQLKTVLYRNVLISRCLFRFI